MLQVFKSRRCSSLTAWMVATLKWRRHQRALLPALRQLLPPPQPLCAAVMRLLPPRVLPVSVDSQMVLSLQLHRCPLALSSCLARLQPSPAYRYRLEPGAESGAGAMGQDDTAPAAPPLPLTGAGVEPAAAAVAAASADARVDVVVDPSNMKHVCGFPGCRHMRRVRITGLDVLVFGCVCKTAQAATGDDSRDPVHTYKHGPRFIDGAQRFSQHCRTLYAVKVDDADLRLCYGHELLNARNSVYESAGLLNAALPAVTALQLNKVRRAALQACLSNPAWWRESRNKRWVHFIFHAHEWGIPEAWLQLVQPVAKKHAVVSGYAFPEAQGEVLLEFVVTCARYFGGFKYQTIEWATGVPEKEASVIARHWLPACAMVLNTVFQFHNSLEVQYHTQTPGENGELLVNGRGESIDCTDFKKVAAATMAERRNEFDTAKGANMLKIAVSRVPVLNVSDLTTHTPCLWLDECRQQHVGTHGHVTRREGELDG
jgi:hypothetical protein